MNTSVIKKDGVRVEPFDFVKIQRAVNLASDRVNVRLQDEDLKTLEKAIMERVENRVVPVAELHDIVIDGLRLVNPKVAESYKSYRGYKINFNKTFSKIIDATRNLIDNGDKENANKNSTLISTKKELTSGIVSKHVALDYELPQDIAKAHKEGYLHIHDLTDEIYGSINCCLFDMQSLMKNGYDINGVANRQPNHLETALSVISDIILSASSQQFGGFTVPEIDTVLAPYVKLGIEEYAKLFEHTKNVYENEEAYLEWVENYVYERLLLHSFENMFDHRLNTINNSNGQTSFTTITFGLETTKEGRLVSKAILNARLKGIGKNKITAIFPKLVFLHRAEINGNVDSPNYDLKQLGIECSMKRMYPDWLSLDEGYLGEIYDKYKKAISPMGCRAFLSPYYKKGGLKPLDETDEPVFIGRGNCGAVSINLPRLAIESNGDLNVFFEKLDHYIDLALKKLT